MDAKLVGSLCFLGFFRTLADVSGKKNGARRGLENGPKRRIKLPLLGIRYKAIPSPIPSHFFAEKVRVPKAQIANFAPPIRGAMAGAVRLRGRSERLMFDSLIGARF